MDIYCYKIVRDYGFAPNPFFGICTLATCKWEIRKYAQIGSWIAGFGGKGTIVPDKLIYLMHVDDAMTFDEYWNSAEFQKKKPAFDSSLKVCYGDNIYHHKQDGSWAQENSHHSKEDGINEVNLKKDTKANRVLISRTYWYFGREALIIPKQFKKLIPHSRDYERHYSDQLNFKWENFHCWIQTSYEMGQHGLPCDWKKNKGFTRYKGE